MVERRGPRVDEIVGSAVPPAVFVAVTSWTGYVTGLVAAGAVVLGVTALAAVRGRSVGRALSGFVGIGVAATIAWYTGSDAAIFLPDIWWSLGACLALVVSAVLRVPLVGIVWSIARQEPFWWRRDPRARRALTVASLACAAVFGARFAVQRWLYDAHQIGWLAVAKIAMGLPLTLCALAVVVWAVRSAGQRPAARNAAAR